VEPEEDLETEVDFEGALFEYLCDEDEPVDDGPSAGQGPT